MKANTMTQRAIEFSLLLIILTAWALFAYTTEAAPIAIEASSNNAHAGGWGCTQVSAECEDRTAWQDWPDVDHSAGIEALHCDRVHPRYDTGAGYDMTDAGHTEIAMWFSLSPAGRMVFLRNCNKGQ